MSARCSLLARHDASADTAVTTIAARLPQDSLYPYHLCGRVFAGGDCDA